MEGRMENKRKLLQKGALEPEFSYFELQAYWGGTKHYGGLKATRELIELLGLGEEKYVLDVGCGVGSTACYIAKRYGCKVVGIDISYKMLDWAKKRTKREKVEKQVELMVADAQSLPFKDNIFDSVICESVTSFVEDKPKAVREYIRVTKPEGCVGLNEGTWLNEKPPQDLVEYLSLTTGVKKILTCKGWAGLLENSGLRLTEARVYKINNLSQFIDEMRQLGFRDFLMGWGRFMSLFIKSQSFRKYLKELMPYSKNIRNMFNYLGYGIYIGDLKNRNKKEKF
jgi:ubiquinone/menaquinone biosynthesis C-methylase UbiE